MSIHLDGLLTLSEFAVKAKIKLRTAREWRYRRKIPFTRIGRKIYIPVGAVESLLRQNAVDALGGSHPQISTGQGGAPTTGMKPK